jgi:hypothetical protein
MKEKGDRERIYSLTRRIIKSAREYFLYLPLTLYEKKDLLSKKYPLQGKI